jgi:hypothetical protein
VTVVGGSFWCAVAVRLALDFPELVGRLMRVLRSAVELPGSPEPPKPDFGARLEPFVTAVAGFARE